MRKWLARFSFSFLVLAAVLVWEGRKARERGDSATLHYIGAAVLAGAAFAGMRERHRPPQ
jgi:hypothetical protein